MSRFAVRTLVLADLFALWFALLVAAYFTGPAIEGVRFLRVLEWRISLQNLLLLLAWSALWVLLSALLVDTAPDAGARRTGPRIALLTAIGTALLAAASKILALKLVTPSFLAIFAATYLATDLLLRSLHLRVLTWLDPEARHRIHLLFFGATPLTDALAESLQNNRHYQLLGYFAASPGQSPLPYLGSFDRFQPFFDEAVVDQIVVTIPLTAIDEPVQQALREAEAQGIEVLFPVELFAPIVPLPEPLAPRTHLVRVAANGTDRAIPLLSFDSGPQMGWPFLVKRLIDVTGALGALLLLSPLLLAIALAIRVTMGAPVLFVQPRLGYHRRVFPLYKFRTMIPNADALRETLRQQHNERDGAAFKMRNDPRVTPLGRWLRKLNLDELPQLFNVLKGDMSLVGPRPLPLDDYAHMDRTTYLRRVSVLPGITCTWQISDRSRVTFDEWMRMDLDYIDHWSLKRDLALLVKTVWVVVRGRGDQ